MIRFINTSTSLPVDRLLKNMFFEVVDPGFLDALGKSREQREPNHVDIIFVSAKELDAWRTQLVDAQEINRGQPRRVSDGEESNDNEQDLIGDEIPNIDVLGVYFPHHPALHRRVVCVSPEKVMAASWLLKCKAAIEQPLGDIYPALLNAVVYHELAHCLMDHKSNHWDRCGTSWEWLARQFDADEEYARRALSSAKHCSYSYAQEGSLVQSMATIVEESLANAIALKQRWTLSQFATLQRFVEMQPKPYCAGVCWDMCSLDLLDTAFSWRSFKEREVFRKEFDMVHHEKKSPLHIIVEGLQKNNYIGKMDFEKYFYQYAVSRLSEWQADFESGKPGINALLNGTFGILHKIGHFAKSYGIDDATQFAVLKQWAANKVPDGIEAFEKKKAERAEANGEYESALRCHMHRQANLPALRSNDYWRKREAAEVRVAIERTFAKLAHDARLRHQTEVQSALDALAAVASDA